MITFIVGLVVGYHIHKYQDVIIAKVKDILDSSK